MRGHTLHEGGKTQVLKVLAEFGWNRSMLADFSGMSASTIYRFISGQRVDLYSVQQILNTLGLKVEDCVVKRALPVAEQKATAQVPRLMTTTTTTKQVFYMKIRSKPEDTDTQLMIQQLLEVLRDYLEGCDIELDEKNGTYSLVGTFTAERRADIEDILRQLAKICSQVDLKGAMDEGVLKEPEKPRKRSRIAINRDALITT